jgi:hypothetical protein
LDEEKEGYQEYLKWKATEDAKKRNILGFVDES